MVKTNKTPGSVLQSFIGKYQISAFSLSKSVHLTYKTIRDIIKDEARITVPTAMRLGKFFGNSPQFWLAIQLSSEINKLSADKKFTSILNNIPKASLPKPAAKEKPVKRKSNTLSGKRKKSAKIPGAKKSIGKRTRNKK